MTLSLSDDAVLRNFKTNVELMLSKHGISQAELSRRAGFADAETVTSILNSASLPSMAVPIQLADALRVPVEALLRDPKAHLENSVDVLPLTEVDAHATHLMSAVFKAAEKSIDAFGTRPTMDAIISWWKDANGQLVDHDQLSPHFDLVQPASNDHDIPDFPHVGALGLSAQTLGSAEGDRLKRFISEMNAADIEELNRNIQTVTRSGVGMISPQTRIVHLPDRSAPIEVSFVRLMLPVTDVSGQPFVLNYSTLLSESKPSKQDGWARKN